jgi:hypothetical protein
MRIKADLAPGFKACHTRSSSRIVRAGIRTARGGATVGDGACAADEFAG